MAVDKMLHFGAGMLAYGVGAFLGGPLMGLLLAFFAGLLKEVYDFHGYGTVDAMDFLATLAGGITAWLI